MVDDELDDYEYRAFTIIMICIAIVLASLYGLLLVKYHHVFCFICWLEKL